VVDEITVLKDLQSDLRRAPGHYPFDITVQQVNGDGVSRFLVDQLGMVFFFAEDNQVSTMRAQRSVIVVGCVAVAGGSGLTSTTDQ
jgi:hypothetical protein